MFKELMHNLMGSSIGAQGMANMANMGITSGQLTSVMQNTVRAKANTSKRIFHGNIEVLHVSNGYVVNIATKEGYEYTTHIASTIVEVNEIIAAAMVAFQLENK
jgi:hypothetical protein